MKSKVFAAFLAFASLAGCVLRPRFLPVSSVEESRQLVIVLSPDDTSTAAALQRFQKMGEKWVSVSPPHPVMLGRAGLAPGLGLHDPTLFAPGDGSPKREGDGKSPAGIFALGPAFGYAAPERGRFRMPYVRADEFLECVDDPASPSYNELLDNRAVKKNWISSEQMRRADEQYKWGVFVAHNAASSRAPAGGSCIFLHVRAAPGAVTAGCTAMSEEDLLVLMHWLDPRKKPMLVQVAGQDYPVFQRRYGLPDLK